MLQLITPGDCAATEAPPGIRLAMAVVAMAVSDYIQLQRMGVIENGEAVRVWPTRTTRRGTTPVRLLSHYDSTSSVEALITFFRSNGFRCYLDACGDHISHADALEALGIPVRKKASPSLTTSSNGAGLLSESCRIQHT